MSLFKPFRFIDKPKIERKATEILKQMHATPGYPPQWPLDASRVAEFLGLDIVWDSIPDDEQGAIAARILPLEHLIEINENVPTLRGGFGESTIAHEVGHWVLHIDLPAVERFLELQQQGSPVEVEPLLCRSAKSLRGMDGKRSILLAVC